MSASTSHIAPAGSTPKPKPRGKNKRGNASDATTSDATDPDATDPDADPTEIEMRFPDQSVRDTGLKFAQPKKSPGIAKPVGHDRVGKGYECLRNGTQVRRLSIQVPIELGEALAMEAARSQRNERTIIVSILQDRYPWLCE